MEMTDLDFDSNKTIRTIFSDTSLNNLFQKKFGMDMPRTLASRSPEIRSYVQDVYKLIIDSPRLKNIYSNIKIPVSKSVRRKRLTLKELKEREAKRGYQTENDRAMVYVNKLENLVAQLQRRGQKELISDEEARSIISSVRLFEHKVNKIIKKSNNKK